MKTIQWQNKIGGAILVISLLFGTAVVLSTTAQAQNPNDPYLQDRIRNDNGDQYPRGRNWDRYGNYGGSIQLRQTALNAGYNEGVKEGRQDQASGRQSNYQDSSAYRKATKDYRSSLGDRELYRRYFREAFENGYNAENYARDNSDRNDRYGDRNDNRRQNRRGRNWDRYDTFGGSFQLRQTGLNAGYNQGIKQGRKDRKKRNGNSYQNQSDYQNATKDYSAKLGDRELYRRYYRQGYDNGYEDGYGGY